LRKLLIALLLALSLAFAATSAAFAADLNPVTDIAGLLTDSQLDRLNERAEKIREQYKCDVAIIVVDEKADNPNARARQLYEDYSFGYGADNSGILFFLSIAERDYALVAFGFGNTAFTDHGKDVMLNDYVLPLLADNKYYEAFSAYLDKAEEFLAMARDGTPFDVDSSGTSLLVKLAVVILLPLLIAFIVCSSWKKQMKTAVKATAAANYIPTGGFNLTDQTDMFLYRTQERRKIEKQPAKSGGTTKDSKGYSGKSGKF